VGLLVRTGLPTSKERGNGKAHRSDGWVNALTGLGDKHRDKRRSSRFKQHGRLDIAKIEALYRENGIARRVVDLPANAMTRNWFTLTGDEDERVTQRMETLRAQFHVTQAETWARIYGGSILLMVIDDGQFAGDEEPDLTQPVKVDNIKSVNALVPFAAWREVDVIEQSLDMDPTSPTFGKPLIYRVTQLLGGGSFEVHVSRIIRFDGELLPRQTMKENAGWHDSVYQTALDKIRQVDTVFDNAEIITQDFVQVILKVADLAKQLGTGNDAYVKARLDALDLSRHVLNSLLIDTTEDYSKSSSSVAGLSELLDRFMMALSAVTGIPVTLLMGRSPAGMNATGESDLRFWYDKVQADQNNALTPRLEKLIRYLFVEGGNKESDEWSINFNPLFQMTEKEKQEIYKGTAESDAVYIDRGVLDPNEVAVTRFSGTEFNTGVVQLDKETRGLDEPEDEPKEPIEEPSE
jgi:phage-related protein (TIGR01555 family)